MFEVRLESVVNGKFDYVEHIFTNKESAVNAVDRHVVDGFSCHGLNNPVMQYAYGHVLDETDRIIYRKSKCYP